MPNRRLPLPGYCAASILMSPYGPTKARNATVGAAAWAHPKAVASRRLLSSWSGSVLLRSPGKRGVVTPCVSYASISEIKIVAPPVAKFGMSADAVCPSDEDMLPCNRSMSWKYPSKTR